MVEADRFIVAKVDIMANETTMAGNRCIIVQADIIKREAEVINMKELVAGVKVELYGYLL